MILVFITPSWSASDKVLIFFSPVSSREFLCAPSISIPPSGSHRDVGLSPVTFRSILSRYRRSAKQEQNNASDASDTICLRWILSPEPINLSRQSLFPSNHRLLGKLEQQERPGTERPFL